jgi:hypothetical protein
MKNYRIRTIRQPIKLHCPQCWRWHLHYRNVLGAWELFTCSRCGHVQTYLCKREDSRVTIEAES